VQKQDPKHSRLTSELMSEGPLGSLIERARQLDTLDRLLRQSLPPELAGQCRLANVRADKLIFLVSSPVWSAKLRLHTDVLLNAAAAVGLEARSLITKVATMQPVPPDAAPRSPLSPAARDALRAAAGVISDPELRDRLLRLASLADE
jgi:hypothetical protein